MKLSVIIVNWNTRDLLLQCVESLYTYPPNCEFEIIVVDNASTDDSKRVVRERFPQVCLIKNLENVGFARANNQAIRASRGEYLLLLNSDTQLLPNSLTTLVECISNSPTIGIAGGKLLNPDGSFQAGGNNFPTLWSELALLTGTARWLYSPYFPSYPPNESKITQPCDWVGGAYLLARRATIERVGLLDEGYFMYAEEVDWCYRTWQAGWKVWYCAEAPIIHHGGGSSKRKSTLQLQRLYASKARFLERSAGRRAAGIFRASVRLISAMQAGRWYLFRWKKDSQSTARAYWGLAREEL